jgi:predicted PurR-regulated permease PerM
MAAPARTVVVRPRTVFSVLGITLLVAIVLLVIWATRGVVAWILIAAFLAMALNPAIVFLERKGMRRGRGAMVVFLIALLVIAGLSYLLIPPLVDQITEFVQAVPDLLDDLTRGRGPLGFLQREYQIVDRVRAAIEERGVGGVLGFTTPALSLARGVLTAVAGVVTIVFLTLFMLLDGPRFYRSCLALLPERLQPRYDRASQGIYRSVGGYVSGNLLISIIAGLVAMLVLFLLDMPFVVSLGVVVAVFDLVPLAGATIAAVIVVLVALAAKGWVTALVLGIYFLIYQQVENHLLQPVVYGRTVQLSPLIVLISVLIGADLAGVLGALGAIPIAGALQVVVGELLSGRDQEAPVALAAVPDPGGQPPTAET